MFPTRQREEATAKGGNRPAEPAPAFVLLASDDGSDTAGATVAVTGGKPLI